MQWWRQWSSTCNYHGRWRDQVLRSLVTLKALTYAPTGGIIAAATTSLPDCIGRIRNWDYRYCWLRDATFTLYALMNAGYKHEALGATGSCAPSPEIRSSFKPCTDPPASADYRS
jgi:GH15 family glucan-1,4-alpha-glucosidase